MPVVYTEADLEGFLWRPKVLMRLSKTKKPHEQGLRLAHVSQMCLRQDQVCSPYWGVRKKIIVKFSKAQA